MRGGASAVAVRRGGAALLAALLGFGALPRPGHGQDAPLRLFISVDMEGIGGIGTGAMTSASGKDYATGRQLVTDEVNAVVRTVLDRAPTAEILVNDSHGDHQNVLHTQLDPRVTYIQGSIKPLGMVQGLDASFDGPHVFLNGAERRLREELGERAGRFHRNL